MVVTLVRQVRDSESAHDGLTARELQVLDMLRRGSTTASIAQLLGISRVTVRRHVSTLVRKVGVRDRAALVVSPSGGRLASVQRLPPRIDVRG